jgi:hypothetical protein
MQDMVLGLARGLASNTSRRGFMARTSYVLVGLVGGSALLELMRGPEAAHGQRRYPTQAELNTMSSQEAHKVLTAAACCFHWYSCRYNCGSRAAKVYDCPCGCSPQTCTTYYTCSQLAC